MALELSLRRLATVTLVATTLTLLASSAHADDESGRRFGVVGSIGGGLAVVGQPGALPGFIGYSDLGFEILGEVRPWGGFLGGDFISSGDDGRWTAYGVNAGVDYRLFGNSQSTALFLRGGLTYQRWLGSNAGCGVDVFLPNSCILEGPMQATFQATTDMLGLIGGVRLEMPIRPFFLAFSAKLMPTVSIDNANPVATLQLRFTMEAGFRDARSHAPVSRSRNPYEFHSRPEGKQP